MKKKSRLILAATLMIAIMLTGCGADFTISSYELENYANSHGGQYAQLQNSSEDGWEGIQAHYAIIVNGTQVELLTADDKKHAVGYFEGNRKVMEQKASSSKGSNTIKSGDYTYKVGDQTYRLMYCDNQCLLAIGKDEAKMNTILKDLNVIKK